MAKFWLKNNKIVIKDNKFVLCDHCPCGVPCATLIWATLCGAAQPWDDSGIEDTITYFNWWNYHAFPSVQCGTPSQCTNTVCDQMYYHAQDNSIVVGDRHSRLGLAYNKYKQQISCSDLTVYTGSSPYSRSRCQIRPCSWYEHVRSTASSIKMQKLVRNLLTTWTTADGKVQSYTPAQGCRHDAVCLATDCGQSLQDHPYPTVAPFRGNSVSDVAVWGGAKLDYVQEAAYPPTPIWDSYSGAFDAKVRYTVAGSPDPLVDARSIVHGWNMDQYVFSAFKMRMPGTSADCWLKDGTYTGQLSYRLGYSGQGYAQLPVGIQIFTANFTMDTNTTLATQTATTDLYVQGGVPLAQATYRYDWMVRAINTQTGQDRQVSHQWAYYMPRAQAMAKLQEFAAAYTSWNYYNLVFSQDLIDEYQQITLTDSCLAKTPDYVSTYLLFRGDLYDARDWWNFTHPFQPYDGGGWTALTAEYAAAGNDPTGPSCCFALRGTAVYCLQKAAVNGDTQDFTSAALQVISIPQSVQWVFGGYRTPSDYSSIPIYAITTTCQFYRIVNVHNQADQPTNEWQAILMDGTASQWTQRSKRYAAIEHFYESNLRQNTIEPSPTDCCNSDCSQGVKDIVVDWQPQYTPVYPKPQNVSAADYQRYIFTEAVTFPGTINIWKRSCNLISTYKTNYKDGAACGVIPGQAKWVSRADGAATSTCGGYDVQVWKDALLYYMKLTKNAQFQENPDDQTVYPAIVQLTGGSFYHGEYTYTVAGQPPIEYTMGATGYQWAWGAAGAQQVAAMLRDLPEGLV